MTQSKRIYTLERPVWLDAAGMSKGINHDRQHLGIILAAGQSVKIRQANPAYNAKLTLRLLNDDRETEAEFSVGSTWIEAHIEAASVPFIDTPYVEGTPVGIPRTQNSVLLNLNTQPCSCRKSVKKSSRRLGK